MGSDPAALCHKLAEARARLVEAGVSPADAAVDVDVYVRVILGWDKATLVANQRDASPATLEPRFSEWIARRELREPTAYILSGREFWGREFLVTPAVLVPRPETEFIVEEGLPLARGLAAPRIADIGTGSGILALTFASELPASIIVATDLSGEALDIARENAKRLGVADRVAFVETSYLDGVGGDFDLIVANPPYVAPERDGSLRSTRPSVSRFTASGDVAVYSSALPPATVTAHFHTRQ